MRTSETCLQCLALVLLASRPGPAMAQALYAGAGLGPTILFDQPTGVKTTYFGGHGVLGLDWPSRIGVRLEGTETYGFLWLSADLTYRWGNQRSPLQPYAVAGAGVRVEIGNADPIGTAGAGVRAKLIGPLFLFGEGRVHYVFSSTPALLGPQPRAFLLLTFGASLVS